MSHAAIQAFHTARRAPVWKLAGRQPFIHNQVRGLRSYPAGQHSSSSPSPLPSSLQKPMYFRKFSLAILSTAVASCAWYAYQGDQSLATQVRWFASSAIASAHAEGPSDPTRRALLIRNDQVYTTTLSEDQPLSKTTDDPDRRTLSVMTMEKVNESLRKKEESYIVNRGTGVARYDVIQVASNDPIEDDHAERIVRAPSSEAANPNEKPSNDWGFWAVFDGHAGWHTASLLRYSLISSVKKELEATYKAAAGDSSVLTPTSEAIDAAIKKAFLDLDHEIVYSDLKEALEANSRSVAADLLSPALSGSCALLSFYDSASKDLKVAVAGDSRAVLGRLGPGGKWTATPLSEDLTGGTPSEAQRLRKEHPGEPDVTRNGRILGGLEPSRAFGDAVYKWSKDVQNKLKSKYFGRRPSHLLKTPPYVTAEPVITTTKIDPSKGDFVVMATDGLWEMLSNEEVVGLVAQWIEQQKSDSGSKPWLQSWFSFGGKEFPVELSDKAAGEGQRPPKRQQQYAISEGPSRFVCEDKNAATHLVRNALGGKDEDMVCALLTIPAPYARRYRDDLTVEVIFFGQSPDGEKGTIEVNQEASAANVKAPLSKL